MVFLFNFSFLQSALVITLLKHIFNLQFEYNLSNHERPIKAFTELSITIKYNLTFLQFKFSTYNNV